jgi:hypothetical protein
MNESETITLLAINKYTRRLTCALYPQLYAGIRQIWNTSKAEAVSGQVKDTFQQHLSLVPRWNQDFIDKVYRAVLEQLPLRLPGTTSHNAAKMLEDLIARVLLLNTEVMASPFSDGTKIPVRVPPPDRFIHSCYKHCARAFYVKHYLMEDRPLVTSRDKQARNSVEANDTIMRCIEDAIEELVPLDNLLSQNVPSKKRDASPASARSRDRSTGEEHSRSRSRGRSPGPAGSGGRNTPNLFETDDEGGNATDEAEAALRDTPAHPPTPQPESSESSAWDITTQDHHNNGAEATIPEDVLTVRFGNRAQSSTDDDDDVKSRSRDSISPLPRLKRSAKSTFDPADLPPIARTGFFNKATPEDGQAAGSRKDTPRRTKSFKVGLLPGGGPAEVTEAKPVAPDEKLPSLEGDVGGMDYYDDA